MSQEVELKKIPFLDWFDCDPGLPAYTPEGLVYNLVRPTLGLELAVQEAEKGSAFLVADQPWEDRRYELSAGTIIHDAGRFRMWYFTRVPDGRQAICYADSDDGMEWKKPALGLVDYQGRTANNIIRFYTPRHVRGFNVFVDPMAESAGRYKVMFGDLKCRPSGAESPDGIHWTWYDKPVLDTYHDSSNMAYFDSPLGRYVGYFRVYHTPAMSRRVIARAETTDYRSWPEPEIVLAPDSQDPLADDFYIPHHLPYGGNAGRYLMFISVYHRLGDTFDLQLAVSRDGRFWTRPQRRPIVPRGDLGSGEEGMVSGVNSPQGLLPLGDRWAFAYNRTPWAHKNIDQRGTAVRPEVGHVRWATWRPDRLVALQTRGYGRATLTRQPCSGGVMRLNLRTFPSGHVRAELIEADKLTYDQILQGNKTDQQVPAAEGFSFADCRPMCGDDLRQVVRWKGGSDLSRFKGRQLVIRLEVSRAQLFGLEI